MTVFGSGYYKRNVHLSIIAALVSAGSLFGIFRIAGGTVGYSWLGAWVLIQGLMLVARVADSGVAVNITRDVARRYRERGAAPLLAISIGAFLIASLPAMLLAVAFAFPIGAYVSKQYGAELDGYVLSALVLLSVLSAVLTSVGSVLLAVAEGAFLLRQKNSLMIGANMLALALAWPLLASFGPVGIGVLYVILGSVQVAGGFWILYVESRRSIKDQGVLRVGEFTRDLWRENLQFSGVSLVRLSFEPVTKLFLSWVFPLAGVAAFELALRVTTQVRVLVQSAIQPLIAMGSRRAGDTDSTATSMFARGHSYIVWLVPSLVALQVLSAPVLSLAGFGALEVDFCIFVCVLAGAGSVNTAGLAGYSYQVTSGRVAPLLWIQVVMAAINIVVGCCGVVLGSAWVVVFGYAAAFVFGGWASRRLLPVALSARELAWAWLLPSLIAAVASVLVAFIPISGEFDILVSGVGFGLACLLGGLCAWMIIARGVR